MKQKWFNQFMLGILSAAAAKKVQVLLCRDIRNKIWIKKGITHLSNWRVTEKRTFSV